MDVVIFCGGTGTRMREETEFRPKPMVPIGGLPMVVHIMKTYAHYGHTNFILALGYKQEMFKEYFTHYHIINNDITLEIGLPTHEYKFHTVQDRGWRITLADTGRDSLKSERLRRAMRYVKGDVFMCTYGDGVADIDIGRLAAYHKKHGKIATVTGINPAPRFGEILHENGTVNAFAEKPRDGSLINGGFFVFNREVEEFLADDVDLEVGTMVELADRGELAVYHHEGFWQCADTLKDIGELEQEWNSGKARWKVWE